MSATSLKPLRKKLLSENVVGAIRSAILNGELELGQRLVETDLAEQLGVSRGPIREALRLLAAEGLVVINVHRGTFIVQPTKDDVEEIYSLREALESLAVKRVIEIASDEEIEGLFETAKQFTAASSQKKVAQLVGTNMALHGELFKLARHERLSQIWATLESQLRLCNLIEFERRNEDMERAFDEHMKILDAIRDRDSEAACRFMSEHIQKSAQVLQATAVSS